MTASSSGSAIVVRCLEPSTWVGSVERSSVLASIPIPAVICGGTLVDAFTGAATFSFAAGTTFAVLLDEADADFAGALVG